MADDAALRERFAAMRRANKVALARLVAERVGVSLDPDALFDVHIKRIHEYKRQLLNILETIALYARDPRRARRATGCRASRSSRARRPPGYGQAKLIIKLINDVARRDQRRPGGARPAQGRVPAELQREPRRGDHSGRGPVRADFHGRHGGIRHRQHEARAQWRADHRHARRRQHRDPRTGRGRAFLPVRADGRRGGPAPARRAWTRRGHCQLAGAGTSPRRRRGRGVLRRTIATRFHGARP